mgnify:CR=1 FL=1
MPRHPVGNYQMIIRYNEKVFTDTCRKRKTIVKNSGFAGTGAGIGTPEPLLARGREVPQGGKFYPDAFPDSYTPNPDDKNSPHKNSEGP